MEKVVLQFQGFKNDVTTKKFIKKVYKYFINNPYFLKKSENALSRIFGTNKNNIWSMLKIIYLFVERM